jgi:hypothetical protein
MATIVNGNERGRPGKWIVDYHDANGVRRWATFRTRAAAKKKLGLVLTQDEPPRSTTTLKELAKTWLPQVKVAVKPATFESYEMMLRRHLLPGLGRQTRVQALKAQPILNLLVRKLQPKGEGGDGLSEHGSVHALDALGDVAKGRQDGVAVSEPRPRSGQGSEAGGPA